MTAERTQSRRNDVGVVAIGRNEGDRLRQCLESALRSVPTVVYVDSGSTDGSVELAAKLGVQVVELDLAIPFTAARARNEGIARLRQLDPIIQFVQVVDGDCELVEGWIARAIAELDRQPQLAVVCGRRRERQPDASIYNRLCDMEWDTPVGEARACGGDAVLRLDALDEIGGYDDGLIAGEEPEMCVRLRARGRRIARIDHDMTLHDAQIVRFAQWWKRAERSGHAFAEGRAMHGRLPERYCVHEVRSILEWGILLPAIAFGLAWITWGASLILLAAYGLLWRRVRDHRTERGNSIDDASMFARYCVLGKFPQAVGVMRYLINRLLGRRSRIIEYKHPADCGGERSGELAPNGA